MPDYIHETRGMSDWKDQMHTPIASAASCHVRFSVLH